MNSKTVFDLLFLLELEIEKLLLIIPRKMHWELL